MHVRFGWHALRRSGWRSIGQVSEGRETSHSLILWGALKQVASQTWPHFEASGLGFYIPTSSCEWLQAQEGGLIIFCGEADSISRRQFSMEGGYFKLLAAISVSGVWGLLPGKEDLGGAPPMTTAGRQNRDTWPAWRGEAGVREGEVRKAFQVKGSLWLWTFDPAPFLNSQPTL